MKLTTNRRSAKRIVHFNNDFFEYVVNQFANYQKLQDTYSQLHQELPDAHSQKEAQHEEGYIRVNLVKSA